VTSTKMDTVVYRNPMQQFFWGDPFEEFFGVPRRRGEDPRQQKPQIVPRSGFGSGVIVSKDGYILTNYHVVGKADEISVKLSDDRKFDADIIGVDSLADVAVIKIRDKVTDLPVISLGDSDKLRPGDWVVAVGNPFSLSSTVTTGIVSALGRRTGGGISYQDFIQTDAAINPGNSGGALVNIEGELIGINTMIYTQSGGYMGIGFAIPVNMARAIMEDLIYEGRVLRGWLGVYIQDVNPAAREAMGLGDMKGVLISDVTPGDPADKAGIRRGDFIISIDGKKTKDANDLRNTVATLRPGSKMPVELIREGKKMTLQVKVAERPDEGKLAGGGSAGPEKADEPAPDVSEKLGIKAGAITAEVRQRLGLSSAVKGVVVLEIQESSPVAREDVKVDDIIMEVNRKPVATVKEFKDALKTVKPDQSVLFLAQREGKTFYVAFKLKK